MVVSYHSTAENQTESIDAIDNIIDNLSIDAYHANFVIHHHSIFSQSHP